MTETGDPPTLLLWTLILVLIALFLALVNVTQILTTYSTAYAAADTEITTFIDTVDSSIQENESYDRDVARVQRLEDKMRLGRLLREIQKGGDDLREALNALTVGEGSNTLKTSAKVLWAAHRKDLEERVRRLDMLRDRFLVLYFGTIAATLGEREKQREKVAERMMPKMPARDIEKTTIDRERPRLPKSLSESIQNRPVLRRLQTSAMGHSEKVETPHRRGWAGVVQELQRSPVMQRRRLSAEMRSPTIPPITPLGSPIRPLDSLDTIDDRIKGARLDSSP